MIVDGVHIARTIEEEVRTGVARYGGRLCLRVFVCVPNLATQKFLGLKRACAERIGVVLTTHECAPDITTEEFIALIAREHDMDGVIIQLPFPQSVDINQVLETLPLRYDVDAIGTEATAALAQNTAPVLPPVVAAIKEIAERHAVSFKQKKVVVVGNGRLVGAPASIWCAHQGADVVTLTKETASLHEHIRDADILVLGAGVPGLIRPEMLKEGVVIFDAGSSEDAGKLVGDADPACAEKAALFTPVPGGIGPITVSIIFKNLLTLAEKGME